MTNLTKSLSSLLLLTLGVMSASAQVKIGLETGVNFSHYLSSQSQLNSQVGGMKAGFQVATTVDYEFKNHLVLSSGIQFLQNRSNMKLSSYMVTFFPNTEVKINNLILPLKIGYNFHISDNIQISPYIGIYGAYGFSAGSCSLDIVQPTEDGANIERVEWNPMKGYSYSLQNTPNHATATLTPFRHWDYGGMVGFKTTLANHYHLSFNYMLGIKQVHAHSGLRNSNFQLNIGYTF